MTKRALIQRVSRVLAKEGEVLKKSRGMRMFLDVGDYCANGGNADTPKRAGFLG